MSTTKEEQIVGSTDEISVGTSYSGSSSTGTIEVGHNSAHGVSVKVDAGSSITALLFKIQVRVGGEWSDLYRDDGNGVFEVEEYSIPITATGLGQLRSLRFSSEGIREFRYAFKTDAGTATIKTMHLFREAANISG